MKMIQQICGETGNFDEVMIMMMMMMMNGVTIGSRTGLSCLSGSDY